MKKLNYLLLASLFVTAFTLSACLNDDDNMDDPSKDESVKVTEESLEGIWDGSIDQDLAQGYLQRWRLKFEGKNYTSWHTHQVAGSVNDEVQGLKTVGNKEQGTWEYANGTLILTPSRQWASYLITSMSPLKYTYYNYNVETMECDQWYETPESFIKNGVEEDLKNNSDWYISKWKVVNMSNKMLSVKINMDTFKLYKQ